MYSASIIALTAINLQPLLKTINFRIILHASPPLHDPVKGDPLGNVLYLATENKNERATSLGSEKYD